MVLWLAYQEEDHMDPVCTVDAREGKAWVDELLAEFGGWLGDQRGLAPITVVNCCWVLHNSSRRCPNRRKYRSVFWMPGW